MVESEQMLEMLGTLKLPASERIVMRFKCSYSKNFLRQGYLFLSQNYLCFLSCAKGQSYKIILQLKDIKEVKKTRIMGIFNPALRIIRTSGNSYLFPDFLNRERALLCINCHLKEFKEKELATIRAQEKNYSEIETQSETGSSNLDILEISPVDEEDSYLDLESQRVDSNVEVEEHEPELSELPVLPFEEYRCLMRISLDEYESRFIMDDGAFTLEKYYKFLNSKDINSSKWQLNQSTEKKYKSLQMTSQVRGQLFLKWAYTEVELSYSFAPDKKSILLQRKVSTPKLQMGKGFYLMDTEVIQVVPGAPQWLSVRCCCEIIFKKGAIMKGLIRSNIKKEYVWTHEEWNKEIKREKLDISIREMDKKMDVEEGYNLKSEKKSEREIDRVITKDINRIGYEVKGNIKVELETKIEIANSGTQTNSVIREVRGNGTTGKSVSEKETPSSYIYVGIIMSFLLLLCLFLLLLFWMRINKLESSLESMRIILLSSDTREISNKY